MSELSRREFLQRTGILAALGLVSPYWLAKNLRQGSLPSGVVEAENVFGEVLPAGFKVQSAVGLAPAAVTPFELQTPHHALLMDLDPASYQTRFDQLGKQGYRAIGFQGVSNGSGAGYGSQPATLSAIFVRDGSTAAWYQFGNIDADRYQAEFTKGTTTGFKPITVSAYQDGGALRFAATWIASSDGYQGIHNDSSDQYQTFVDAQTAAGLRPEVVDGYPVGTPPGATANYISLWDNANNLPWVARHGLTSDQYQSEFDNWGGQGYRVYSLSVYQINGVPYFAAFWVKDNAVPGWIGRHNASPTDMFNESIAHTQNDLQPIVIEAYDSGDVRNFASVWIQKVRTWTATGTANPDLKVFDDTLQTFMQTHHVHSAQLAVTKDSRLVYARGYSWDYDGIDPVQPDSLFRIASVTKPITSAGIMLLVQQGKLNVTDKLVNLITLPSTPTDTRMNDITVQNLLQHQGGWNRDKSGDPMFNDVNIASALGIALPITPQNIIAYMTGRSLDFAPGTAINYSNYGYLLLGQIIEAVTKQAYATYITDNILTPIKMSKTIQGATPMESRAPGEVTYYTTDPRMFANVLQAGAPLNVMAPYGAFHLENMAPHGGWLSTAIDMARFSTIFDATKNYPLLTKATIDQIFAVPATGKDANGHWYGYGWGILAEGTGLYTSHDGSLVGTFSFMARHSDGVNFVILLSQRDDISDPNGSQYEGTTGIDGLLKTASDAVTNWPTGDLFP